MQKFRLRPDVAYLDYHVLEEPRFNASIPLRRARILQVLVNRRDRSEVLLGSQEGANGCPGIHLRLGRPSYQIGVGVAPAYRRPVQADRRHERRRESKVSNGIQEDIVISPTVSATYYKSPAMRVPRCA